MSTRGCIARRAGDGWQGVYHHSDSYPTGLGCYLFRLIRHVYRGDVGAFLGYAIDEHDGGWSHIFPSGTIKTKPDGGWFYDAEDRRPECYCHGYFADRDGTHHGLGTGIIRGCECHQKPYRTGQKDEDEPSCDPLFIEWVYVFDAEVRTIGVLASCGEPIPGTVGFRVRNQDGSVEQCPEKLYRHRLVTVVELDGPEPNWLEIECWDDPGRMAERLAKEGLQTWVDKLLPPVMEPLVQRRLF